MRLRKRLAELEERLAALETPDEHHRLPAQIIPKVELDAQQLWREHVGDYGAHVDYGDDEGWHRGYL